MRTQYQSIYGKCEFEQKGADKLSIRYYLDPKVDAKTLDFRKLLPEGYTLDATKDVDIKERYVHPVGGCLDFIMSIKPL